MHHHFESKREMLEALVDDLISRFRSRTRTVTARDDELSLYIDAALKLDEGSDIVAARCWVGVFAEAIRGPDLLQKVRAMIDSEIVSIRQRSCGRLSERDAGAVLAFIVGALVMGAFAPKRTAGFAAPALRKLVRALMDD